MESKKQSSAGAPSSTHTSRSPQEYLENFSLSLRVIIARRGLFPAVKFANASTAHRYTGIFRFETDRLINVCTFDGENDSMAVMPQMPINDTYSVFIFRAGRAFTVIDARQDPRLVGHPKREMLRSFCGAPLLGNQGAVHGAVCHFDPEPDRIQATDFEELHIAASMLQEYVVG